MTRRLTEGEGGSGMVRPHDTNAVGGGRSPSAAAVGCMVWERTGERPLRQGRQRLKHRPRGSLNEFENFQTNSNPN
jgi:hypothetical protein